MRIPVPERFVPGAIINDSYEILRLLGVGGASLVYLCRHRELDNHLVALKVFCRRMGRSHVDVVRFKRELLAAYEVNHPNVIRCYDLIIDSEFLAFTMEYLPGGSLAEKMSQTPELNFDQIVSILSTIASGLHGIHQAGIVHRDLKPENILITSEGNIKISDFSVALMTHGAPLDTNGVLGTIEYVSPEYIDHGTVDQRSDIYSVGVMAYQMITGRLPFEGRTPLETMTLRVTNDAEPVQNLRRDCPWMLNQIVNRALSRNPADRYQSTLELLGDLAALHKIIKRNNHLEPHKTANKSSAKTENLTQPTGRKQTSRHRGRRYFGSRRSTLAPYTPSCAEVLALAGIMSAILYAALWFKTDALAVGSPMHQKGPEAMYSAQIEPATPLPLYERASMKFTPKTR